MGLLSGNEITVIPVGSPCHGLYDGTGSLHYGSEAGLFHNSDSYLPGHAHGPLSRVSRWLRGRLQRQQEDDIADHGSGQLDAVTEHRGFQRLCTGHCNCGHTHHGGGRPARRSDRAG